MSEELLSVAETAELLHPLKPATVQAWVLQRRVPFLKLGGRVLLRRSEVEALIAGTLSVKPAPARKSVQRARTARKRPGRASSGL
jgi:excisionase family DNA binding protein